MRFSKAVSSEKLRSDYNIGSTHMVLVDAGLSAKEVKKMIGEMESVDGVKYVLGLESAVGSAIPEEAIPDEVKGILESDNWELLLINSEYKVASDACNEQIASLNTIIKSYDADGMLIGEGPCMKDMIETTDHDFKVVNSVSIIAIFFIILLVEKSVSLPILLIALIELGTFQLRSIHSCIGLRTVCGDLRRRLLLGYRDHQFHVHADGKRSDHQYAARHLYAAGDVYAL